MFLVRSSWLLNCPFREPREDCTNILHHQWKAILVNVTLVFKDAFVLHRKFQRRESYSFVWFFIGAPDEERDCFKNTDVDVTEGSQDKCHSQAEIPSFSSFPFTHRDRPVHTDIRKEALYVPALPSSPKK